VTDHGTALVTGAGRGLGLALALELLEQGFGVVATVRDPNAAPELNEAAAGSGGGLRVETLDVTRPETFRVPNRLRVLVNSAGIDTEYLPVEHAPLGLWRAAFETNLFGVVELTRRAIPSLRRSGGGVICNVTSAALLFPMPFYAAYRASKAAVAALGESLRAELAPAGIRILEVMPGPVRTDMLAASDRLPEASRWPEYRALAERAFAGRRGVEADAASPEEAARRVVAAILDEGSPLRISCDPVGEALLRSRQRLPDEAWLRSMLATLAPPKNG
jgi:NAD(P)-dependent dehydrogenase (short-subunit alcohol dehydrogenase family)